MSETAAQDAVRLADVRKEFGELIAVDGVTLDVGPGEFFSMLGPSGCGKTTMLRMIAGLEVPTSGRIFVGGQDLTNVPAYRRPVNTVFQNYALFPHLSVFDNVGFGLRERGVSRKEAEPEIREMLSLVRLDGRERARPSELSGGQQQRVGLARALIMKPKVLLLDEPLGALDLKLRRQMQTLLKQVHAEVGIAFVYVTHDQEEAFSMSDRVAVVKDGRVEQVGDPQELYQRPATRFVAGFVGSANQLEGDVVERPDSSRVRVRLRALDVEVTCAAAPDISVDDAVVVIARPEVLELVAPEDPGERTAGTVTDVSYLGPQAVYTIRTAGGESIHAMRQGWEPVSYEPGDATAVRLRPDQSWAIRLA